MSQRIQYRPYQPGDEAEILRLYEVSFGRPMDEELWRWQYANTLVPRFDIQLAFEAGPRSQPALIGHGAGWPAEFVAASQRYSASRTQNIMVHPEHRRGRIVTTILDALAEANKRQNVDFWYAFPTRPASLAVLTQTCGFSSVTSIQTYERPTDRIQLRSDLTLSPAVFTERDAALIEQTIPAGRLHVPRTLRYLDWRYACHPSKRYSVARWVREQELAAVCIYKIFEARGALDVLELGGSSRDSAELLERLAAAVGDRARVICLWTADADPLRSVLERCGFAPGELSTTLVYKPLSDRCPKSFQHGSAWYLTHGDSDVY